MGDGSCNPNWIYNLGLPDVFLTVVTLAILWHFDRWPWRAQQAQASQQVVVDQPAEAVSVNKSPSRFMAWANRLDAPHPLPSIEDVPPVRELNEAVTANPAAAATWEHLEEGDRVGLMLFVRAAWGGWARRRRAEVVAHELAGGPERLALWRAQNRAFPGFSRLP